MSQSTSWFYYLKHQFQEVILRIVSNSSPTYINTIISNWDFMLSALLNSFFMYLRIFFFNFTSLPLPPSLFLPLFFAHLQFFIFVHNLLHVPPPPPSPLKDVKKVLDFYTPCLWRVGCNSFDIICVCVTTLTTKRTDIWAWISACRSRGMISRSSL